MAWQSLVRRVRVRPPQTAAVQTAVLAVLFAAGMLGGWLYAGRCYAGDALSLADYLEDYCALYAQGGEAVLSLLSVLRLYFGYAAAAFLLGFAAVGALALPALSAVYGFTAMFAVSCFVRVYGRYGTALALSALGVRFFFTVPCFLWIASHAWAASSALASATRGKRCAPAGRDAAYVYRLLICVVWLIFGVCCEMYLTPSLFHFALQGML